MHSAVLTKGLETDRAVPLSLRRLVGEDTRFMDSPSSGKGVDQQRTVGFWCKPSCPVWKTLLQWN